MTKEPEKVQLTVITQEIEDADDSEAPALVGDRDGSASAGGGGESSEGEADIEIEHVGDESSGSGSVHGLLPAGNITFDVRRRTLINIYQRTILEEFYRCGMTSASLMLNHLHTAAAEKTGLEISVVKNWIRNRRRPTAVKSAEKFVEKIAHGSLPPVPTIPNIPSLPSSMTSIGLSTPSTLSSESSVVISSAQPSTSSLGRSLATHLLPEPKRICTESALSSTLSAQLPPQSQPSQHHQQPQPLQAQTQHQHHISVPIPPQSSLATAPTAHHLQLTPPSSSLPIPHTVITSTSSATSNGSSSSPLSRSLLVKVRISGSGESDFVEVEVPSLSYSSLLKSCCEELELVPHEIAKIRKLPNVWVRKDKDIQRMKEGQELEIIIKSNTNPNSTPPPITTMLTVNPFSLSTSSNGNLTFITSGASIGGGGGHGMGLRTDNDNGLLAALTSDSPVSMPELINVSAGGGNPSNQVNGLH